MGELYCCIRRTYEGKKSTPTFSTTKSGKGLGRVAERGKSKSLAVEGTCHNDNTYSGQGSGIWDKSIIAASK